MLFQPTTAFSVQETLSNAYSVVAIDPAEFCFLCCFHVSFLIKICSIVIVLFTLGAKYTFTSIDDILNVLLIFISLLKQLPATWMNQYSKRQLLIFIRKTEHLHMKGVWLHHIFFYVFNIFPSVHDPECDQALSSLSSPNVVQRSVEASEVLGAMIHMSVECGGFFH